jgi:hypothetical protein
MVEGLDVFTEHFADHTAHYVLIGGTACDRHFSQRELPFRVTKDLDIILVVEALNDAFVKHFYEFVRAGEYVLAEVDGKKTFYRFIKPKAKGYPDMLELFSRHPGVLSAPPDDIHITDIETGEDVSSLSAILMNDDYYNLTMKHSPLVDGLRVASEPCLVCLKTRAYFGNLELKEKGVKIQEDKIYKHKTDVLRLLSVIDPAFRLPVPDSILPDIEKFIVVIEEENQGIQQSLKAMKIEATPADLIEVMRNVFLPAQE